MIDRIRIGVDMLDPKWPKNQWEIEKWVRILCATNTVWRSEDHRAITNQVYNRFNVLFQLGWERFIWNLWEIFHTQSFRFWNIQASAHAIVCHLDWDMADQNYTRSRQGLKLGLSTMHGRVAVDANEKARIMNSHAISMWDADPTDTDKYLALQERIVRETKLKLNPLLRMPLMATSSPEDCARLFEVMENTRANLVVYMLSGARDMVNATIIRFPNLRKLIPALADDELELAA